MHAPLTAPDRQTPTAKADRIAPLQYLRGIAAMMVLLYHASHHLNGLRGEAAADALFDGRFGVFGVAIFFALSGFLMARLAGRTDPYRFLLHRIVRIYPIYFVVLGLYVLAAPLVHGHALSPKPLALPLIPVGPIPYVLSIEWTLVFEVSFYVFIFLVMLAGGARRLPVIAAGWLAVIAAGALLGLSESGTSTPPIDLLPFDTANVAFACGLLVPWLLHRWRVPTAALLALPIAMALARYLSLDGAQTVAGVAAALMVAAALGMERLRWTPGHLALMRLGDASYALYLVHVPVIAAVYSLLPAAAPAPLAWGTAVAAAIGAALPLGRLDLALYARLRTIANATPVSRARLFAFAFTALFIGLAGYGSATFHIDRIRQAAAEKILVDLPASGRDAVVGMLRERGQAFAEPAGAVEQVTRLRDGRIAISGWAADLTSPGAATYVALYCNGARILIEKRARKRPDIAIKLARPALGHAPVGFVAAADDGGRCGAGQLLVVAADARGRGWPLPVEVHAGRQGMPRPD